MTQTLQITRAERSWKPLQLLTDSRTWRSAIYLTFAGAVGFFWFAFSAVAVPFSVATGIIWIGIPLMAAVVIIWRAGARVERSWLRLTLGMDIPAPYRHKVEGSMFARLKNLVRDPATWKDGLYLILLFPLGVAYTFAMTTAVVMVVANLVAPILYMGDPGQGLIVQLGAYGPWATRSLFNSLVAFTTGIAAVLATPYVIRALAETHSWIARGLLGQSERGRLAAEAQQLKLSRAQGVSSATEDRKRVEQDLHDGAQQRVLALSMALGRARQKFDSDPEAARALLDEAHAEAKLTIAELRHLARGIHPPILTDRGLDAAISGLAARLTVPVDVSVDLAERPPASVESIAYFVVAESLTNVAKHAGASHVSVKVIRSATGLTVAITDDGAGGARQLPAGGLTGLADRAGSIGGTLAVSSPEGGPTVVTAELPYAW